MAIKEALAFDDVSLVPVYTEVRSRTEPDISTTIAGMKLRIPMISSPMDTVTESRMAIAIGVAGGMGIIHRFMSPAEQVKNLIDVSLDGSKSGFFVPVVPAIGIGNEEIGRLREILGSITPDAILIDVANGHSSYMKEMIQRVQDIAPDLKIIAGSVATGEGFRFLAELGVSAVRCGISGGCFVPGSLVNTLEDGLLSIEDVTTNHSVVTHTGSIKKVCDTLTFHRNEELIRINGIGCTKNHEFYVIMADEELLIDESNIADYARWIPASDLDIGKHILVEI